MYRVPHGCGQTAASLDFAQKIGRYCALGSSPSHHLYFPQVTRRIVAVLKAFVYITLTSTRLADVCSRFKARFRRSNRRLKRAEREQRRDGDQQETTAKIRRHAQSQPLGTRTIARVMGE
jgi:hypothetical protein